mgnify:FL=1|tara:strand:- start:323 stop:502 length:180 start_codon:yes stop_codon:yes gene_type:complete
MTKREKQVKEKKTEVEDLYKDYEPDGKDLAEWTSSDEQDPNYDPEDHWASIETDKALGK